MLSLKNENLSVSPRLHKDFNSIFFFCSVRPSPWCVKPDSELANNCVGITKTSIQ